MGACCGGNNQKTEKQSKARSFDPSQIERQLNQNYEKPYFRYSHVSELKPVTNSKKIYRAPSMGEVDEKIEYEFDASQNPCNLVINVIKSSKKGSDTCITRASSGQYGPSGEETFQVNHIAEEKQPKEEYGFANSAIYESGITSDHLKLCLTVAEVFNGQANNHQTPSAI